MCAGFIAVLLPRYLLALGFGQLAFEIICVTTLFGSALATILGGLLGNRFAQCCLLLFVAAPITATGPAFAGVSALCPLVAVAFKSSPDPPPKKDRQT
jgi:hypothetical protein